LRVIRTVDGDDPQGVEEGVGGGRGWQQKERADEIGGSRQNIVQEIDMEAEENRNPQERKGLPRLLGSCEKRGLGKWDRTRRGSL
jgi:hypothetical protein